MRAETILAGCVGYPKAVSKLIVRETRLSQMDTEAERVMFI